jgi:very-short-patch-repair endonuclease
MSYPAARPALVAGKVFLGSEAVAAGVLTRAQLRSTAWRRVFRDAYADAALPDDHGLRCAAARLLLPAATIAGRSAAYLHGATVAGVGDPVEMLVPPQVRYANLRGVRVRVDTLAHGDVHPGPGLVTSVPRTAFDVALGPDLVEAVAVLDALARCGALQPSQLAPLRARLARRPDAGRSLRALDLHDPRAESPQESRLRVRLILAGLPTPQAQYEVAGPDGRFIARVDLAWPEPRVAVEYDGEWHADAVQLRRDRRRLNRLLGAGWVVLHVTGDRLRFDVDAVVAEMAHCLASRRST